MPLDFYNEDIDEVLEDAGVQPHCTPVDNLPEHAQWALAEHYYNLEYSE